MHQADDLSRIILHGGTSRRAFLGAIQLERRGASHNARPVIAEPLIFRHAAGMVSADDPQSPANQLLEGLLRQRGHAVTQLGRDRDLLLPFHEITSIRSSFKEILYKLLRKDNFRKALRNWAYGGPVVEGRTTKLIDSYTGLCDAFGLDIKDDETRRRLYASTFEWFVSELFRREFSARATGFRIRLKDADPDDEFDCVALLDRGLVYAECKTGAGELYEDVRKFIRRDAEVNAEYSFFLYDRDYTFKRGKEDLPDLSSTRANSLGIGGIDRISGRGHSFFLVYGKHDDAAPSRYFLASSVFDHFEDRIRYMIRYSDDSRGLFGLHEASGFTRTSIPFRQ